METAMFCSECGNKLEKNDRFCMVCGARVENLDNTPTPEAITASTPSQLPAANPDAGEGTIENTMEDAPASNDQFAKYSEQYRAEQPLPNNEPASFCTECGSPIEQGAVFCAECGTPVEDESQAVHSEAIQQVPSENATPFILNREVHKHFNHGSEMESHNFTLVSRGLFSINKMSVSSSAVDDELNIKMTRNRLVSSKLPDWDPLPLDSFIVDRHSPQ